MVGEDKIATASLDGHTPRLVGTHPSKVQEIHQALRQIQPFISEYINGNLDELVDSFTTPPDQRDNMLREQEERRKIESKKAEMAGAHIPVPTALASAGNQISVPAQPPSQKIVAREARTSTRSSENKNNGYHELSPTSDGLKFYGIISKDTMLVAEITKEQLALLKRSCEGARRKMMKNEPHA